jgi:hypothetical protein
MQFIGAGGLGHSSWVVAMRIGFIVAGSELMSASRYPCPVDVVVNFQRAKFSRGTLLS